ncbi:helix-turn-helix domain-containing protein [Arcobacter sp. FWKO B]|uniref:helix-turn-helix domain-containing protein n=1 Tax=Arcobacter sp. FWKO B TaxID=2593672 RepID=UPI0018A60243|nr:helix-turn-helix transcriptional regulator [Arcobacter sp. FWKO B]QOG11318.1 helix-turn-helix transcriptional regulator [Arcobacter sp. FWKO B]
MTIKKLGKDIQQRRKELNLEMSDIADYSNISIPRLSNIENGKSNPTIKTIEKILDVLGLELVVITKDKNATR